MFVCYSYVNLVVQLKYRFKGLEPSHWGYLMKFRINLGFREIAHVPLP